MARINHVKRAQQRYEMVPVLNEDGTQKSTPVMRKDGVTPKTTKKGRPITRRVTVEDRTKPKPLLVCGACHKPIDIGTPYKWVKIKSGPYGGRTMYRHESCPAWKQSELTTSKMSGIYAAQERADDEAQGCEDIESLESLRDELAEEIEAVGDEYEESAQNMEDGFGHETYQSEELRSKAEEIKGWADEIRNVQFDDYEGEDADDGEVDCEDCEGTGYVNEDPENDDPGTLCENCDGTGRVESDGEERENWLQEQRDKLIEELGNCPV